MFVGAMGALGLLVWSPMVADLVGRPATSLRQATSAPHVLRLVLERAHFDWEERPVYVLTNESTTPLTHFVIRSWEGDLLPILDIGLKAPPSVPAHPLAHPPYTLPPGSSVWFVGQEEPWPRYVIDWLTPDGVSAYQVVSACLVSPA